LQFKNQSKKAKSKQAGVYLASGLKEFEEMMEMFIYLKDTKVKSKSKFNLRGLSNAGFEKCAIADNISGKGSDCLNLEALTGGTYDKIEIELKGHGVDFIDIDKILDLSPLLPTESYGKIMRYILEDDKTDCAVLSIVPETGALDTLPDKDGNFNENSLLYEIIKLKEDYKKPFVISISEGKVHDPLVDELRRNGIVVFRYVDEATQMLGKYMQHRSNMQNID